MAGCSTAGLILTALVLAACGAPQPGSQGTAAGIEVVAVWPGGAAARAGVLAGDRLLSFSRRPGPGAGEAAGPIRSCLDLAEVEIEQAPRGPVRLSILRQGQETALVLPPGDWSLEVAPGGGGSPAERACRALAEARRAYIDRRWPDADAAFAAASEAVAEMGEPRWLALVRHRLGLTLLAQEKFEPAARALNEGLELRRKAAPGSLAEAASWHGLGQLEQRRGDLAASDQALEKARALRERLAPESLDLAWTLVNLGINAYTRHDYPAAEGAYEQARALMARQLPGSLELAGVLSNLGLLAREVGELEIAEQRFTEARPLFAALEPEGENAARNLVNLALVALDRGELAVAERLLQEALVRYEMLAPESLAVAMIYENLGKVARDRADYREAETLLRRSLAIRQELAPGSTAEARSLSALAWVLFRRQRPDEGEAAAGRVLAISTTASGPAPEATQEVASSLQTLAEIAAERGDLALALERIEESVRLKRADIPGSLRLAIGLETYGEIASRAGHGERAEECIEEAIGLFSRLAPDSFQLAQAWGGLGDHHWRGGRTVAAVEAYRVAIEALEAQVSRLGGDAAGRASFELEYAPLYQRLLALELERGRPAAALEVLERSRGRGLLAQLVARDLGWRTDLPPALGAEERDLDRTYDRAQKELAQTDSAYPGERRETLLAELAALRSRRSAFRQRLVASSPRYAALRYPATPELAALRRQLEAGTLWLAYSVGPEQVFLFAVSSEADEPPPASGLSVHRLAADRGQVAREVTIFRSLILRGQEKPEDTAALVAQGRRLYDLLLAPAEAAVARAERLLLSPDGPLHLLPFAALRLPEENALDCGPVRSEGAGGRQRDDEPCYLVEHKPLLYSLSASLHAELRRSRHEAGRRGPGFAFVAPSFPPPGVTGGGEGGALARYRAGLPRLMGPRAEAEGLAALFSGDLTVFAGTEARERRVKELPGRAGFVHFASHALLDHGSPLDSGVALAAPAGEGGDEDNGLLQAWEVFDQVRLDTDLVTLSACETGLGGEGAGEGLVGLSRAFQYAGARSVLASLWQVSDRSTAELMRRFYGAWAAGQPRDLALAEAQRALLAGDGASAHPFHWAAFELSGDAK